MIQKNVVVSRTLIYGVGAVIRAATSIVMLPIYTKHLSPGDYGAIEVLNLIIDVAALVFGARITVSILRFWQQADNSAARGEVITTALYLTCLFNGAGVLALVMFSGPVTILMYGTQGYAAALMLFSLTLLFTAVIEVGSSYLRILDSPWTYVSVSMGKLLLQVALNIWFVVIEDLGLWGVVYSTVISSGVVALALGCFLVARNGALWQRKLVRPMLGFTWPMIITGLGMFFIMSGDRYFLRVYQGIEEVGVYALAYRFGPMIFSLVWSPFMTFWEPRQFELLQQDGGDRAVADMFGYANVPLLAAGLGVSLFAPEVVALVAAPPYAGAASVIPVICLSYVFQAWTSYTRIALLHSGRTRYLATVTYYSVALIAGLYMLLIPDFGISGAAWATVIAMYVRWGMVQMRSHDAMPIAYPLFRLHCCLVICCGAYLACGERAETLEGFLFKCLVYGLAIVGLTFSLVPRASLIKVLSIHRHPSPD